MTKKRRTKREKMSSAAKKSSFDFVFDLPNVDKTADTPRVNSSSSVNVKSHDYIIAESRNTLTITAVITVVNILLLIALKQNYINLFGLDF